MRAFDPTRRARSDAAERAQDLHGGARAELEVRDAQVLVRGVDGVVGQAEAGEDRGDPRAASVAMTGSVPPMRTGAGRQPVAALDPVRGARPAPGAPGRARAGRATPVSSIVSSAPAGSRLAQQAVERGRQLRGVLAGRDAGATASRGPRPG